MNRHGMSASMSASAQEITRLHTLPLRQSLFPMGQLNSKDLNKVLRDLRHTLFVKKISNYEFFKLMDLNQDGFISINEFHTELPKILPLPKPILDGLFAYMDRHRIGMIDY
jgi:hypothetical protein